MKFPIRYHNYRKRPKYTSRSLYRRAYKQGMILGSYEERVRTWVMPPSAFEILTYETAKDQTLTAVFCAFLTARHNFQEKDHCYNRQPEYHSSDGLLIGDSVLTTLKSIMNVYLEKGIDGIHELASKLRSTTAVSFYEKAVPVIESILDYSYAEAITLFEKEDDNSTLANAVSSREELNRIIGITPEDLNACQKYRRQYSNKKGESE